MPNNLSLSEAALKIKEKTLDPLDLLKACLNQIHALEGNLRAWVTLDQEKALADAQKLRTELANGTWRGPLHGIPIGIKDIYYTQDLRTTAGSKFMENFIPKYDATAVSRLRSAGAIILGKTVTTEFACFDPPETRNPWNLNHTPGGSSSGSAAAVASRMCPAALGSQTGGSIARPASYCGIVGIKPTYGYVSVYGIVPVSFSLDHPGPFARSVTDAALVLQTIAGADPKDPLCRNTKTPNYENALENSSFHPPRIGLIHPFFMETANETMRKATNQAVEIFRSNGAKIYDLGLPTSFETLHENHRRLMCAEAGAYHADRFEKSPQNFQPSIRGIIEEGLNLSAISYAKARYHQIVFRSDIRSSFEKVDLLLTPGTITTALSGLSSTGDPGFNSPWSYAGIPTLTLPVGQDSKGLPTAIQLIGQPFKESNLLSAARWCEKCIGFHAKPLIVPSIKEG